MNKTYLVSATLAFVLLAGLVSCSPDKSRRDNFRAQAPIIVAGDGELDLKSWDRRSQKTLDLQDSFNVSASRPARLEVKTTCRHANQGFTQNFLVSGRTPVHVFEILPSELLTADFVKNKIDCGFVLTIFNEVGSRHIFQVSTTQITEARAAGIPLEYTKVFADQMPQTHLRFANPGKAEIRCQDVTTHAERFDRAIKLNQFDIAQPKIHHGRHPHILKEKSLQPCRVVVVQDGVLRQISPRFLLQFPVPELKLSSLGVRVAQNAGMAFFGALIKAQKLEVARAVIDNPEPAPRHLRLSKRGFASQVEIIQLATNLANTPTLTTVTSTAQANWLYAVPYPTPEVQITDQKEYWDIVVKENGKLNLYLHVQPDRPSSCVTEYPHNGVLSVNGEIEEVSKRGETIQSVKFEISRYPIVHDFPVASALQPWPQHPSCAW